MKQTICDLSDNGLLKVSGQDAKKLLQGQLTCHVDEITTMQHRLGAHCNQQGRVISLFRLFQLEGDYFLLLPRSMVFITLTALKKYAVFYKVDLQDVSDEYTILGCVNERVTDENIAVLDIPSQVTRSILVGKNAVMQPLRDRLTKYLPASISNTWKYLDIQDGIPNIYPESSGKFLPHDINLPALNGVSFDKGCFTGQEIIARMHYRGKLKNTMHLANLSHSLPPLLSADIYADIEGSARPVGSVIDYCSIEPNEYRSLILIDEANAKNNHLFQDPNNKIFFTIG